MTGAFVWLGILTTVFVGALWFYTGSLTDVRKDISNIDSNVAVQTKSIDDIDKTVDRIDAKLNGPIGGSTAPAAHPTREVARKS